jgi:hypothetical protein
MDKQEGMDQLNEMYKAKEWYHSVGLDQYGRIVVYVKFMNHETLHDIPDNMGKHQVLVHFAGSKLATREQFVSMPQAPGASFVQAAKEAQANGVDTSVGQMLDVVTEVAGTEEEEKSILYLQKELERLEKICGSYTLQDIFYEIQDGKNAVTNMSARYPEVHTRLLKLYNLYGFDVIYEELDG